MKKVISRKDAINYIYKNKNGTMKKLKENIGYRNIKSLELMGFIKRGQEKVSKENIWTITKNIKYIKNNKNNKILLMDKVHNFINYTLMKDTSKNNKLLEIKQVFKN